MLDARTCVSFGAGLKDLIDCGDNGTLEQRSVLQAIALGLLKMPLDEFQAVKPVNQSELAKLITNDSSRRRYIQLAVMLELCRHQDHLSSWQS